MDFNLNNKVAIVLAANKGLGKAIATALSAEGAKVVIGSRNEAELSNTAGEISTKTGNEVIAISVDVANAVQVDHLIQTAAARFGRIDILVNNSGGPPFNKFENFKDEDWEQAFELTLKSLARLSRLVLP